MNRRNILSSILLGLFSPKIPTNNLASYATSLKPSFLEILSQIRTIVFSFYFLQKNKAYHYIMIRYLGVKINRSLYYIINVLQIFQGYIKRVKTL